MAVLGATSLTGCNSIPDFIAGGSLVTFQQTSAPTSWTKQTSHDNKALRVVSGVAGSGGSTVFTSVFTSRSISGHTLSEGEMPSHRHTIQSPVHDTGSSASQGFPAGNNHNSFRTSDRFGDTRTYEMINLTGSSNSHSHAALDFAVQYVDLIICSKN